MSEVKLSKNESIKTASNYLRGTIADGLADESTEFVSKDDEQLLKFHGTYQQDDRDVRIERKRAGLEKAFSFMIRVRVPGGVSTTAQWLEMDRMASDYGNENFKLTTRQAYQLHGVIKRDLKQTIKEINDTAMDTIAACGDVNRNVMCNPNPALSSIHGETLKVAQAISDHLTPATGAYHEIWLDGEKVESSEGEVEPIYGKTYLPRKFKICMAIPPSNDVDIYSQCLGFIAIEEDSKLVGFNVTVGGGMGMHHGQEKTFPRIADILGFIPVDKAVEVSEEVVKIQRDFGDRTERKHARLKYTIDDRGIEWFKNEIESRLGYKIDEARPFEFKSNGDTYGWVKTEDGKSQLTIFVENGRVLDKEGYLLRTGLREIAKVHKGDMRLSSNQNIIIAGVDSEAKTMIDTLIGKYGIAGNQKRSAARLNSMACVALPTCGLSLAESERYLPSLMDEIEEILDEVGLTQDAITIRMTGCPNGCARPYIAEIAFVGRAPGKYNIHLGGGFTGNRIGGIWKRSAKGDEIAGLLRPILTRYSTERQTGESFGDFVIRVGIIHEVTHGSEVHKEHEVV
ncbi:MAG: NADPH-dependent assimilatory sulfite reductase hemoprotein subunit [Verrucomicrobia bacterium]|jgi:sulfite reductase (NADPH) hemoprotein beta-component|nr:NADPH-dependent assimilatory sulfite reductase hemoprotein subunit [Verrucomicrobiota bacterium]MDA7500074.1 NADPH-dependent assimilatory sulfite reductase hemoprotein subunit [Akkermansiaceae bacterium]MBT6399151.1 NADPH-dependent assimilatory sulfite reductase hemoprotein subunit [Verrucomicrobiota bacterium]MDB4341321.1 NADPH-dependent assimilatory sulfite reductase hemoprotein subunit [Akkermansiaceae bacterium]MDB4698119.1 NADPH-dependent assimilatory sulfite reductase hemoprotein subun